MEIKEKDKNRLIEIIRRRLSSFPEVEQIIIFGSFFQRSNPNDIDIAVVQNSGDNFLTLSLKYRKVLREISKKIPLDLLPVNKEAQGMMIQEIKRGKIIYER